LTTEKLAERQQNFLLSRNGASLKKKRQEQDVSRILFPRCGGGGYLSGPAIARGDERPTRPGAGHPMGAVWPCSGWGLPCGVWTFLPYSSSEDEEATASMASGLKFFNLKLFSSA